MTATLASANPSPWGPRHFVVVGGSASLGGALAEVLCGAGARVTVVDDGPCPRKLAERSVSWVSRNVLTQDGPLPEGELVLVPAATPGRPWPWTFALDLGIATARLVPLLANRTVVVISSIDVYGAARPPLSEDTLPELPITPAQLASWCREARLAAQRPAPPWRVADVCRTLLHPDASPGCMYGLAMHAREWLVRDAVPEDKLTVLRIAAPFGAGIPASTSPSVRRVLADPAATNRPHDWPALTAVDDIARLLLMPPGPGTFNLASDAPSATGQARVRCDRLRRAGFEPRPLAELLTDDRIPATNACGPLFEPPLRLAIPPRPVRPDELADRQQKALWCGRLKHGQRWSTELNAQLRIALDLSPLDELVLTTSGTDALRIAIAGCVGPARPGQLAALPAFTYPATAAVLVQLGYGLRFVDVDLTHWTMDPVALETALADARVSVAVCVDTFGNPCDYAGLVEVCARGGVPLVADSAGAFGSRYRGRPLGTQASAHAFSMSFAKVLSAAGAGGAVVFRAGAAQHSRSLWLGSALMDELHALAALDQLAALEMLVARRTRVAAIYARAIEPFEGVFRQAVQPDSVHCCSNWVARFPERTALAHRLADLGIETRDYFRALHLGTAGSEQPALPVTELLDGQTLALPMSSELSEDEAETVAFALRNVLGSQGVRDASL